MDLKKFIADLAAGYRKLTGWDMMPAARRATRRAEKRDMMPAARRATRRAERRDTMPAVRKGTRRGRKAGHDEAMTPPEPP